MLTDCRSHGDGLIADRLIRNLAARGHWLDVAVEGCELRHAYPANVTLHKVPTGSGNFPALARVRFALSARQLLARLSQTHKFDVVHQLNPVVTGLSLALWGIDNPVVLGPYVPEWPVFVNGQELQKPSALDRVRTKVKRSIWQAQHKVASGIILSTRAALGKMDDPAKWQYKSHVIPYGIDTKTFTPGPLPEQPVILFVGQLTASKGIFVLLEAFRTVSEKVPQCQLHLAGAGSGLDEAKRVAASMTSASSIHFLGRVERDKLPNLIRSCTVACVPSFGEPFGLVALEAMACGRPVVGTDASGLAHLIPDAGGIKVPVGDPHALAEALLNVIGNPILAQSMGEYNRKVVEEQHAWPAVIAQVEQAYEAAIQLKHRTAV